MQSFFYNLTNSRRINVIVCCDPVLELTIPVSNPHIYGIFESEPIARLSQIFSHLASPREAGQDLTRSPNRTHCPRVITPRPTRRFLSAPSRLDRGLGLSICVDESTLDNDWQTDGFRQLHEAGYCGPHFFRAHILWFGALPLPIPFPLPRHRMRHREADSLAGHCAVAEFPMILNPSRVRGVLVKITG